MTPVSARAYSLNSHTNKSWFPGGRDIRLGCFFQSYCSFRSFILLIVAQAEGRIMKKSQMLLHFGNGIEKAPHLFSCFIDRYRVTDKAGQGYNSPQQRRQSLFQKTHDNPKRISEYKHDTECCSVQCAGNKQDDFIEHPTECFLRNEECDQRGSQGIEPDYSVKR